MLIPRRLAAIAKVDDPNSAHGVRVEKLGKDRAIVVATDGWRLVGATFTPAPEEEFPVIPGAPTPTTPDAFVVAADAFVRCATAHKKLTLPILGHVRVGVHEDRPTCAATDLVAPVVVHDATISAYGHETFPRWREVVPPPPKDASRSVEMNLDLLADTLKKLREIVGKDARCVGVVLTIPDPSAATHPVTMTVTSDDVRAWAVQMPFGDGPTAETATIQIDAAPAPRTAKKGRS